MRTPTNTPAIHDFLAASLATQGESSSRGVESETAGLDEIVPSQKILLAKEQHFLDQEGHSHWTPIAVAYKPLAGFYAAAVETSAHQTLIAFESATPVGVYGAASTAAAAFAVAGDIPPALTDALAFSRSVIAESSVSKANIFVAGYSLGAVEAEYVASKSGLGGAGFGGAGVAGYVATPSHAHSNFINYIDYGDPFGNFASDTPNAADDPLISSANMGHVGQIVMVGSPDNAAILNDATPADTPLSLAVAFVDHHTVAPYLSDFGVTDLQAYISPPASLVDLSANI